MRRINARQVEKNIEDTLNVEVVYLNIYTGFFFGVHRVQPLIVEGWICPETGEIQEYRFKSIKKAREGEDEAWEPPLPDDEYTNYEYMAIEREYEHENP